MIAAPATGPALPGPDRGTTTDLAVAAAQRAQPEVPELLAQERRALRRQRLAGALLAPLWFPAVVAAMRIGWRWRIDEVEELRRVYAQLRRDPAPLLICANHLTLVDSAVIAWALGSPGWYLRHYASLPWNVPERRNFAASPLTRIAVFVMKCLPIERGRDRRAVGRVLAKLGFLLSSGEAVLIYPEGGRSRSGRVEADSAAYGVGRLVASVPGCRVLCVYLRGEGQQGCSALPRRRERFHARLRLVHPRSGERGMRRARDLSGQIVSVLCELEAEQLGEKAAA